MLMKTFSQKLSYIFLIAVPFAVTALAFIFGHNDYRVYLPLWLFNCLLMILATRSLGKNQHKILLDVTWPLIGSWMLVSVFAGMGPPPPTAAEWAALATEQQFRYVILFGSGILAVLGLYRLSKNLKSEPGAQFANVGKVMVLTALPLYLANMMYWGFFLTDVFIKYSRPDAPDKPPFIQTASDIFTTVRMIEVALVYLGTAAFAHALGRSGWLNRVASYVYIFFCFLGAILNLLPATLPEPLATASYVSYIPAITLLMPYLIAINLLKKSHSNLKTLLGKIGNK
jgi:hypothetical protein